MSEDSKLSRQQCCISGGLESIKGNGNCRIATQCSIAGLDFTPAPFSLRQDDAFFLTVISEGWDRSPICLQCARLFVPKS